MVVFSLRRLRPDYSDGEETGSGPQSSGHGGFNNTMFHGTAMAVLKGRAVAPELWLVCFGYVSANPTLAERRLLPQVVAAETSGTREPTAASPFLESCGVHCALTAIGSARSWAGHPRGLCTLPPRASVPAHFHLCAKPACPRLDEFLSRRCPDGIWCFCRI